MSMCADSEKCVLGVCPGGPDACGGCCYCLGGCELLREGEPPFVSPPAPVDHESWNTCGALDPDVPFQPVGYTNTPAPDDPDFETRAARIQRVKDHISAELGACEYSFRFPNNSIASLAVTRLSTCKAHNGVHHFAVTGEGKVVSFSKSGYACLLAVHLVPEVSS